ncbi:MAG: hypothetical protein A4E35_00648 [Methanoregula sp. PtaU1.Bin051]|nr:MAG: hypothetical protein A4E35_00648 [Methanoregula sp. PtaU1.Bin051]
MGVREKFSEFRTAYPALISELNLDTINWNVFTCLFLIVIPFLLYIVQWSIVTGMIPYPVAINYFVLTFGNPNPATMFLSNYVHSVFDSGHIYQNALSSIVIFFMMYMFFLVVIPYIRFRIPGFRYRFNPEAFILTLTVTFTFIPFSVSGISIYFGKIMGKSAAWGFSGLLYAFLGFLIYHIVFLFITILLQSSSGIIPPQKESAMITSSQDPEEDRNANGYAVQSAFLVFAGVFIPFLVIALILSELIQPGTGVFAHLGGFMLGFLISPLIEMMTLSPKKKQKIAFGFFLALVVVVPAVFWLAFV